MASKQKDTKQLIKLVESQGWTVGYTGAGHYRMVSPTGDVVVMPSTPGGARSKLNTMARLRRAGLQTPRKGG